ncbi:hypothetical protein LP420_34390 [Massilia sp. B-10]|nr:hypothetical protein LP420_34390 [Massilia sp. B-10]
MALRAHGANAPVVHDGDFGVICQPIDFLGCNYYFRSWCSAAVPPLLRRRANRASPTWAGRSTRKG